MKRTCKECGEKKDLEKFVKQIGRNYRYKCKECKNKARRTGKISATRFKTGQKSIGKTFKKGHIPWYKNKGIESPAKGTGKKETRCSAKYKIWRRSVLERDGKICTTCHGTNRLAVHHIKPWKEAENLRFEITNGTTLCVRCHALEEGLGIKIKSNKGL